jgi:hypothetical protein
MIKGSGEEDIILIYINYMMSQIWLNTQKLIDYSGLGMS